MADDFRTAIRAFFHSVSGLERFSRESLQPERAKFHKLMDALQEHVRKTRDVELAAWLTSILQESLRQEQPTQSQILLQREQEMSIRLSSASDEEILEQYEAAKELSDLAGRTA